MGKILFQGSDAQARGGVAVDVDVGRQALVRRVGGDIGELLLGGQSRGQLHRPVVGLLQLIGEVRHHAPVLRVARGALEHLAAVLVGALGVAELRGRQIHEPTQEQELRRRILLGAAHDQAHPAILPAERQVLGHGEMRRERELLMDHRDPEPLRMPRLIENQALTADMASMFDMCVNSRLNVLISGGTGAGKTTFLNMLSGFIPAN